MADEYLQNARKPQGSLGEEVLNKMNEHHKQLADWAFSHISLAADAQVLDIGCGGGANLERLLQLCPQGRVHGLDYSDVSVRMSRQRCQHAVEAGRCQVQQGDVSQLPYEADSFDAASACETIYFWPDLAHDLTDVLRVLKPGGQFLIICEMSDVKDPLFTNNPDVITVYEPEAVQKLVEEAGFGQVQLHKKSGMYCILAVKPQFAE